MSLDPYSSGDCWYLIRASTVWLPKAWRVIALLQLQIVSGHYAEALDNYSEFKDYIGKIILLKESDQSTQRVITIGDNSYSHLPLLKRSFVVETDKWEINTLKLRCDTKFKEFAFKVDAQ